MPKTKIYYCNKTRDFAVCGESDPSKFVPGRYSTCKECRNKYVRDSNKEKKLAESDDRKREIDPTSNIRYLIVNTILYDPIIDGKSINEKFKDSDDNISEVLCTNTDQLEAFKKSTYLEMGKMMKKIEELTQEIEKLKQKDSLKNN